MTAHKMVAHQVMAVPLPFFDTSGQRTPDGPVTLRLERPIPAEHPDDRIIAISTAEELAINNRVLGR